VSRAARIAAGIGITLTLAIARPAAAEDKVACARAGEKAQRLRSDGKMIAARAELLACARDTCPAVIRSDCAQWLAEVEASTPTIVVRARDGAGRDLRDVRVTIDGALVASTLDGRAVPLDPGAHAVRYEHGAYAPIDEPVIIAAGEKNRLLSVTFAPPAAAAPNGPKASPRSAESPTPPAPPNETTRSLGPSPMAWVFAGVSVAALASFGYFGATGKSDLDQLRDSCGGHCPDADVDRAWGRLVIADVSLGVAVVAAGLSTWLFLTPRRETVTGAAIAPLPGGAVVRWSARF
jgi:hypothetical protein